MHNRMVTLSLAFHRADTRMVSFVVVIWKITELSAVYLEEVDNLAEELWGGDADGALHRRMNS